MDYTYFKGGSKLYGNVELHINPQQSGLPTPDYFLIDGDNSFDSLHIEGDGKVKFDDNSTQTILDEYGLTLTGLTEGGLQLTGTDWSISMASGASGIAEATNCTITNSTAVGGAFFKSLISDGNVDGGGNTGWVFEILNKYWVPGGTGNWSDTDNWAFVSGGTSGAAVPTTGETAIFDGNSGSTIMVLISSEVLCAISIMPDAYYKVLFRLADGGVLSLLDDLRHVSELLVGGSSVFQTNNFALEGSYIAFVEQCVATLGESTITINPGYFEPIITALMIDPSETIDADEVTCIINSDGAQEASFICGRDIGSVTINASTGCEGIYCVTTGTNIISSLSILGDGTIICSVPDGLEGFSNVITADHVVLNGLTPGGLNLIGVDDVWTLSVASGTVTAENCTITNSIATGGATFYALYTDDNVDGGGNTGWVFGLVSSNFLQWNPGKVNQHSDSLYRTEAQRTGGIVRGIFPAELANKLYYQVTIMTVSLANMMIGKGYNMRDSSIPLLTNSLSNLLSKADFGTGTAKVCQGNDNRLNAVGTRMWFYQNTAPTGWVIDSSVADAVLAVKGGLSTYNSNGGLQAGTWSQPTHLHTGPSHAHTIASHNHTTGDLTLTAAQTGLPAHTHQYYNNSVYGGASGGGTPFYYYGGWLSTGANNTANASEAHNHGNTGSGGAGTTGPGGTGNTSSVSPANTWRPLAQVGIICTKN